MKKKPDQKMNSKPGPKGKTNNDNKIKKTEVGAPVLSSIKKKKLTALANKKQKIVMEAQKMPQVEKVISEGLKKTSKSSARRKRKLALLKGLEKEGIAINKKRSKQTVPSKLKEQSKGTSEATATFKAHLSGFTTQATNSDVKVALIGAGAKNIKFVRVIKGAKAVVRYAIVAFEDEASLNAAVKLSNKVKVMGSPIKITVYKEKNSGNDQEDKNKGKAENMEKEEDVDMEDSVEDENDEDENGDSDNNKGEVDSEEEKDMEIDESKPETNGLKKGDGKGKTLFKAFVKNLTNGVTVKQVQDALSKNDLVVSSVKKFKKKKGTHAFVSFPDEDNMKKALELKEVTVNNESLEIATSLAGGKALKGSPKDKSPKNKFVVGAKNNKKPGKPTQNSPQQLNKKNASPNQSKKKAHRKKRSGKVGTTWKEN